jgi:hypothetical protein
MFSLLMPLLLAAFAGPATTPQPAKPAAAEPIIWSATRRLTAADFLARTDGRYPLSVAALTASDIKAGAACRDFVFSGSVKATFDPNTSWIRNPQKLTEALLRHEQLHFDITEIYARRLRQKLVVFKQTADCNKLQPAFNNLTKGVYAEWGREESRYDQETGNGLNAAKQDYWERQVQIKLDQLKEFAE